MFCNQTVTIPPYSNPSQNACESMTNVAETWPHFKGLVSRGQILIRIRFSVNSFRVFWYTVAWLLFLKHLFLDTAASLWCPCNHSHFHILRHTVLTVNQRCYASRGESGIVKTHFMRTPMEAPLHRCPFIPAPSECLYVNRYHSYLKEHEMTVPVHKSYVYLFYWYIQSFCTLKSQ